ncbi:TPA: hypothetical protein ACGN07_005660 [Bacillus cereus]
MATKSYNIANYLQDTKYASEHLIEQIVKADKYRKIIIKTLGDWAKVEEKYLEFLGAEADSPEYFEARDNHTVELKKFDAKYETDHINASDITLIKSKYNDSLKAANGTVEALSGAVLQIAKQGISIVHGSSKFDCEKVGCKEFGSATLLDVIWEGRNQSMHFEERKFSEEVDFCFESLSSVKSVFAKYKDNKNMAHEIIKLLKCGNYEDFRKDMMSFKR